MELAQLEIQERRLQTVSQVIEVAKDKVRTAAFALMHIMDFFEPEEAINFLAEALEDTSNASVRRFVHMKLTKLYADTDQPEEAMEQLSHLIMI